MNIYFKSFFLAVFVLPSGDPFAFAKNKWWKELFYEMSGFSGLLIEQGNCFFFNQMLVWVVSAHLTTPGKTKTILMIV